jgi:hypothetical protein
MHCACEKRRFAFTSFALRRLYRNVNFLSAGTVCSEVAESGAVKWTPLALLHLAFQRNIAYRPVARQGSRNETTAVAMQRRSIHASTTIELILETVFSTWSVQRGYKEDKWGNPRGWDPRKTAQHIQKTDPSSRQKGRPTKTRP